MLVQLYIENVAVIQKAAIRLEPGLNVFTGETGAGKTMLISAIDAVLGERTSREIIRTGESRAMVSALFEDLSPAVLEKLAELGYSDDEGALLISREVTAAGKTGCKLNGIPATTSILREIAPLLIHVHGQRDSQQLLLPERHIELLDAYGELAGDIAHYAEAYNHMRAVKAELESLDMDDAQKNQRMDMLSFQIAEIEGAELEDEGEEETLLARRGVIRNSERILEGLAAGYAALSGGGESEGITSLMDDLTGGVATASEHVEQFAPMEERLREIGYELADFSAEIHSYLEEFDFDPRELDEIEYRLDAIYKLKRKYGGSIAEIVAFCERARQERESITTSEARAEALAAELGAVVAEAEKRAGTLRKKRARAAKEFMAKVEEELAFLDMPAVRLSVSHREKPLARDGADELEFLIVTNVGEPPKPLSKIASGGEIARIMLAVKNVLADRDHIGTLIFDEVDTGVSGRAAGKIGRKLRQVSRARQVICVTHLAQVAACADTHLYISKAVEDGRTFTRVTTLQEEERAAEVARITSGDHITDIALENARQLIKISREEDRENAT